MKSHQICLRPHEIPLNPISFGTNSEVISSIVQVVLLGVAPMVTHDETKSMKALGFSGVLR
jgi:hypothetical protein